MDRHHSLVPLFHTTCVNCTSVDRSLTHYNTIIVIIIYYFIDSMIHIIFDTLMPDIVHRVPLFLDG